MAKVPRFAEAFAGRWPIVEMDNWTATSSSISVLQQPARALVSDGKGSHAHHPFGHLSKSKFSGGPLRNGGRYILVVGNAAMNKNFPVLAKALASVHLALPEIAVVYVGRGPDAIIATTLRNIRSSLQVFHFQAIDEAKLTNLYRHATCLCVPSLYEGFCLPVLEAQALGCPVVCSDRPALPEIAGTGALFVNPTDPDALAKSLLQVLQDPATSEALTRAGYENASKFSWDNAASEYEAVFRRLLGGKIAN
jgi:glycosyltransferase involved in cell wall biosynthesis